jgi:flagellar basal body-associated protein FliL
MAEETPNTEQAEKKKPLMTIAIVAVVMVLEAVLVVGFVMFSGIGAGSAEAGTIEGQNVAEQERTVEIPLVDARFQNLASGQAWTWQVEAVLQVKKKREAKVLAELERRRAEITEGVAMIIRRAAHAHLIEPGLETIHRQLGAYIEEVFGFEPDGEPMVERVLLPKCQGVPPV